MGKFPGQPKKPMTAYFMWMNEEGREETKKENPDMGITEVAKACGEKWKNIDEDVKRKYEDRHKEMKEKYDEENKEKAANLQRRKLLLKNPQADQEVPSKVKSLL